MPVDQYIGGVEHAILHLMYARFFTKALADMDLLGFLEPFANLFTQGMITHQGAKMSKSRGNVISPSAYVERYGADTARCYILFLGPPAQDADWSDSGVGGVYRFLSRVWRLAGTVAPLDGELESFDPAGLEGGALELVRKSHWAIDKVTADIERFQFNTAIAALMELVNDIYREAEDESAARARLVRGGDDRLAAVPVRAAPGLRAVRGADRQARVGGAVAARRRAAAAARHRDGGRAGERQGARQHRGRRPTRPARRSRRPPARRPNVQRHLGDREVAKVVVVPGRLVNFVVN